MHCAKAGIPVGELQQGLSLLTMPRKSGRGPRGLPAGGHDVFRCLPEILAAPHVLDAVFARQLEFFGP